MIRIEIIGTPLAKKRPRFFRRGKFVGTYNAQETEEGKFMFELHRQYKGEPIANTPLKINCVFYMPIPKGTSNKKRLAMIAREIYHIKKPDLDNLIKFAKDCCNGIIWNDDSQVVHIEAIKEYSENPRTILHIMEKK